jgi:hypothetical protein
VLFYTNFFRVKYLYNVECFLGVMNQSLSV